ncbi:MAG: arginine deiminase-related protein, partial [Ignavibacteria bacterium]
MRKKQSSDMAHAVLMVRPNAFGFNPETAASNAFQAESLGNVREIAINALREFDAMVEVLLKNHIDVIIIEDTESPHTPDAVFPNNWFSTHEDGTVILYPMMAPNRRLERRSDILAILSSKYAVHEVYDLSVHEVNDRFLEGTGSIVFDHVSRIAYAALSERTNRSVFEECCKLLGYEPIAFRAFHEDGLPVYHTNVLMHVSPVISAICKEMIHQGDQAYVMESLLQHSKAIIHLDSMQVHRYAGNMLCV